MSEPLSPEECQAYARCAAGFWADLLRGNRAPSLLRDAGHDRERPSIVLAAAVMDAGMIDRHRTPARTEVDAFEDVLAEDLTAALLRGAEPNLGVDYGPDLRLRQALSRSGLRDAAFPFKHRMSVDCGEISVHEGYRAPTRYLCETKRGALKRALGQKCWETSPYVVHKTLPFPDGTLESWEERSRLLTAVMKPLPETPPGPFEEIVDRVWAFVSGETTVAPWPFDPPAKDSPA